MPAVKAITIRNEDLLKQINRYAEIHRRCTTGEAEVLIKEALATRTKSK